MSQTAQPREPSKRGWWILALLVVAGVITYVAVDQADRRDRESDARVDELVDAMSAATITYEVGGTSNQADVTAETPSGTDQLTVDIPLMAKEGGRGVEMTFQRGDFVYISAQNTDAVGTVTCKITASDGSVISESQSSLDYGIATCDGTAR